MKQNRFKSKVLWSALAAQIISLGQLTGLWKELGVDAGTVGNVAALVLQILVTVGVINDATNPKGI
jgi:uncharacterized membrane protein